METLRGGARISGPHVYLEMRRGDVQVHLFGEEHSNERQCDVGIDVVDLLKRIVREGEARVYLEMPCDYESKNPQDLLCRDARGPRAGVLNDLRTCMYIMKSRREYADRIRFVDPRERYGDITFSEEEEEFAASMASRLDRRAMIHKFVDPLRRADADLRDRLEPSLGPEWDRRVARNMSRVDCAVRRGSAGAALRRYRDGTDAVMELYAIDAMLRGVDDGVATHAAYVGSAHAFGMRGVLESIGFRTVRSTIEDTRISCISIPGKSRSVEPV